MEENSEVSDSRSLLNSYGSNDVFNDSHLRVLIFTAAFYVQDGVTLTIKRIISYLLSQGGTALVVTTCPEGALHFLEGYNTVVVPGTPVPFQASGFEYMLGLKLDKETEHQIKSFRPNVAHITVPDFVGLDGIRFCQGNSIPYLATWHSNYVEYLKFYFGLQCWLGPVLQRFFLGFYSHIPVVYVPTPFIKDKCTSNGYSTVTKLRIWGRGVDMDLFSPNKDVQKFKRHHQIPENVLIVMWVGRIVQEKSPHLWFECVKRLKDEGIPYCGVIIGKGSHEKLLSSLPNTIFIGWLEGEELATAYAASDVFLFPSSVETFGNVTLEALSSGLPCIVESGCSGHLVSDGVNGFTCKAGDIESFYGALRKIATDPALRLQLSRNARNSAQQYERTKVMQEMLDNYKDIISTYNQLPKKEMKKKCCSLHSLGTLANIFLGPLNVCLNATKKCTCCCRK